jgi:hypothetical protein
MKSRAANVPVPNASMFRGPLIGRIQPTLVTKVSSELIAKLVAHPMVGEIVDRPVVGKALPGARLIVHL